MGHAWLYKKLRRPLRKASVHGALGYMQVEAVAAREGEEAMSPRSALSGVWMENGNLENKQTRDQERTIPTIEYLE